MIEIRTERLVLRRLRKEDATDILLAAENYEVARWLTAMPHPHSLGKVNNFIAKMSSIDSQVLAITMDGKAVGVIGTKGELGFWIAQNLWGQGLVTEAAKAVIDDYFATQDKDELRAGYLSGNVASAKVQQKLGFQVLNKGIMKTTLLGEIEGVYTVLTRERWLSI